MRKGTLLAAGALALTLLGGPVLAQDAGSDQSASRPDRGDRVERRFDRRGDVIDNRLDRAARRAHATDHDRAAHRLDRRGDGIVPSVLARSDGLDHCSTPRMACHGIDATHSSPPLLFFQRLNELGVLFRQDLFKAIDLGVLQESRAVGLGIGDQFVE